MSLRVRRRGAVLAVVVLLVGLAVPAAGANDAPVTMFREHQVHRLYLAAFGRPPDAAGFRHWVGSSLTIREIAVSLAESPEFLRRYDQTDSLAFVEQLHLDVVGEPGDPQMLNALAYNLNFRPRECKGPGMDDVPICKPHRGAVVLMYANSAVLTALGGDPGAAIGMGGYDQIRRLYDAAFDRMPDESEVQYWLTAMDDADWSVGNDVDETELRPLRNVAWNLVLTLEFGDRYGGLTDRDFAERLYLTALHRRPDESGLTYWTGLLDAGVPRWHVLLLFANSYELSYRLALATTR